MFLQCLRTPPGQNESIFLHFWNIPFLAQKAYVVRFLKCEIVQSAYKTPKKNDSVAPLLRDFFISKQQSFYKKTNLHMFILQDILATDT